MTTKVKGGVFISTAGMRSTEIVNNSTCIMYVTMTLEIVLIRICNSHCYDVCIYYEWTQRDYTTWISNEYYCRHMCGDLTAFVN